MGYRSIFRDDIFAGRTMLVTGGGSGIGRCIAHELAALGARIAIVGRTRANLDTVVAEIAASGHVATAHAGDIRDEDRVRAIVTEVLDSHSRIDGLVNNAGGQFPAPITGISAKGWDAVVRNNLTGGFLMSREVYTQWMEANGGAIVNITAEFWDGLPDMAHSGAARAGMDNFTRTAAIEWAHSAVRVNSVAPGWIASSGFEKYPPWMTDRIRTYPQFVPLRRYGTEAEVSAAVAFLLSDAAAYITGESIRVDGGSPLERAHRPTTPHDNPTPEWQGFHLYRKPAPIRGDDE